VRAASGPITTHRVSHDPKAAAHAEDQLDLDTQAPQGRKKKKGVSVHQVQVASAGALQRLDSPASSPTTPTEAEGPQTSKKQKPNRQKGKVSESDEQAPA
jgi:hypothetical protein